MIREQTSETKRPSEIDGRIENGIPETVEYAGFWIRFGAYIVDLLGMVAGALIVGFSLGYLFGEKFIDALPNVFWNYSSLREASGRSRRPSRGPGKPRALALVIRRPFFLIPCGA